MKTHEEYLAEYQAQMDSARRQLRWFETGKMVWKISGVDRTDSHKAALRRVIESLEELLTSYGVDVSDHTEFVD